MILDTKAVSSLLAGRNQQLNALLDSANQHQLPLAVIAEYQYGLLALQHPRRLESLLRKLEADSDILYPDRATADTYAAIRHDLRMRGRPIPENDLWIAALARQHSLRDCEPRSALRSCGRHPSDQLVKSGGAIGASRQHSGRGSGRASTWP